MTEMTDEQFKQLMGKLERIEFLLKAIAPMGVHAIPQHLWNVDEIAAVAERQRRG